MRILEINVCSGCLSTGTIAARIAKDYESNGNPCIIAYGRDYKDIGVKTYKIGTAVSVYLDFVLTRLFDNAGFNSKRATRKFIKWAEEYDPDVLWLHNLHGYYINIELLFNWIKTRPSMEVKWTLHDCWAFTGHCAHFKIANCYKWEKECNNCPQRLVYPKSILFDGSKNNYNRKKRIFSGVNKMTIITPSDWLRKLVKNSFLQDYNIEVVKNDIDRTVFSHRDSNFRKKYSLTDKKVILGVASSWSKGKGLNDFIELEKLLDNSYTIVLVGTDRRARKELLNSILCLGLTRNQIELAEIYSAADVFINPSREEVFGLTTLEALCCGTPAIVYKDTACEEVAAENGGIAVEIGVNNIVREIELLLG